MFVHLTDEHEKRIPMILDRTDCSRHDAPIGIPCFHVAPAEKFRGYLAAVCGSRIQKAGYTGKISDSSLQLKAASARSARRKR